MNGSEIMESLCLVSFNAPVFDKFDFGWLPLLLSNANYEIMLQREI